MLPHTRQAILDAFKRAGPRVGGGAFGIETHDCFTTSEYMAIDHFGLTDPGESWKAIEEGVIELGRQAADQSQWRPYWRRPSGRCDGRSADARLLSPGDGKPATTRSKVRKNLDAEHRRERHDKLRVHSRTINTR